MTFAVLGFEIPYDVVVVGIAKGMAYGLTAVGIVLVYRVSRVINFAHSALGVLAALAVPLLAVRWGLPYVPSLLVALLIGSGSGAVAELAVIRRLSEAPRLIVMVATIAIAQIASIAAVLAPHGSAFFSAPYPTPFSISWRVGHLVVDAPLLMVLVASPLLVAGLVAVRNRTGLGIASQAAAENAEAAWLTGIPVKRISTMAWSLAGLYSSAAAVLLASSGKVGGASASGLSVNLLVPALAAAILGRLDSIWVTYTAAIGIGVAETLIEWNYPGNGYVQILMLVAVLAGLFFRSGLSESLRGGESGWSLGGAVRALPPDIARLPLVRWGRRVGLAVTVVGAVAVTTVMSNAQLSLFSSVVIFAIMGLSLVVLTGFAGQVSLGQSAFVALGAFGAGKAYALGFPMASVAAYSIAICVMSAILVGLPALRVRGLFLSVATLAFALFAQGWLFGQDFLMKAYGAPSQALPRGSVLGIGLESETRYAWFALACLAAAAALVHRVRSTGIGRSMIAVRDNEPAAMTFSLSPNRVKLTAFGLSGGIAGFAGWLYGGLLVNYSDISITAPKASLELVVMVVLGGVGSVTGAVLGALWIQGIPYFFGETWGLFSSAFGVLLVLLFLRGGLAAIVFRIRDRLVPLLTGRPLDQVRGSTRQEGVARQPLAPSPHLRRSDEVVLEARNITVSFGGNVAVSDVSMQLHEGEVLGILGPNGAGKTTFFDVLTGQIAPDHGQVILHGLDITALRPEQRAELLLGRTFQQARLFDELTLFESLEVALERQAPSELVPSLLGLPPSRRAERDKRMRAGELIELLGLEPFAHRPMTALSTGTRRMAELAAVVAMGSRVVLLDEPTAGVAQAEVEQFTPVIREIADHLGASLIVIEHDIPLMMSMVDRLCVLAAGCLIADGPPQVVGTDPAVIAAYLGTDERVVQRSGRAAAPGRRPAHAPTRHKEKAS